MSNKFNDDAKGLKKYIGTSKKSHISKSKKSKILLVGLPIVVVLLLVNLLVPYIQSDGNNTNSMLDNVPPLNVDSSSNPIPKNDIITSNVSDNDSQLAVNETVLDYLDQLEIIDSDRYTGNEGDSFVFPIGKHQYTRGNTCVDGKPYEHGIEGWLARWNGSSEKSWAYAIFDLDKKYRSIDGECKLIDSYNTSNFNTTLEFWCDDVLIKSYQLTPDSIPFDVNLDVTDCKYLKVYFFDNDAVAGGTSFGLINMALND